MFADFQQYTKRLWSSIWRQGLCNARHRFCHYFGEYEQQFVAGIYILKRRDANPGRLDCCYDRLWRKRLPAKACLYGAY